jgi:signal peptidase I
MNSSLAKAEDLSREAKVVLFSKKGGSLTFRGKSMSPCINDGYGLKIRPTPASYLNPGEVIVFEKNKIIICHRLLRKIRKNNEYYLLEKGDNNWLPGIILSQDIIGRVYEIVDRDGFSLDAKEWQKLKFLDRCWALLGGALLIAKIIRQKFCK